MKKILLILLAVMMMASCVRSEYRVTFMDEAYPCDTMYIEYTMNELACFAGSADDSYVIQKLVYISGERMPLYYVKCGGSTVPSYMSICPIQIISNKRVRQY